MTFSYKTARSYAWTSEDEFARDMLPLLRTLVLLNHVALKRVQYRTIGRALEHDDVRKH